MLPPDVFTVKVRHSQRDRGEFVTVHSPRGEQHARLVAIGVVRSRHSFPSSVSLFAEVV